MPLPAAGALPPSPDTLSCPVWHTYRSAALRHTIAAANTPVRYAVSLQRYQGEFPEQRREHPAARGVRTAAVIGDCGFDT